MDWSEEDSGGGGCGAGGGGDTQQKPEGDGEGKEGGARVLGKGGSKETQRERNKLEKQQRHRCFVTLSAAVTSLCIFPEDGAERGGRRGGRRGGGEEREGRKIEKLRRGEKWLLL